MPRKTPEQAGSAQVHKSAGDAVGVLLEQLTQCQAALRFNLEHAAKETVRYHLNTPDYFDQAMQLVQASARLAEAIAKVKGEVQQHIRVERSTGADRMKQREPVPDGAETSPRASVPYVP